MPKVWSEFQENLIKDLKLTRTTEEAIQQGSCEVHLILQTLTSTSPLSDILLPNCSACEKAFNSAQCTAYTDLHEHNQTSEQQQV